MNELQECPLTAFGHFVEWKVNESIQNSSFLMRNQRTDDAWYGDLRCEEKNCKKEEEK
jgi:hypothetical protein